MCVSAKASVVSSSATPRTIAHQAPLSMGFLRQDWDGLLLPPLGNLPDSGINSHVVHVDTWRQLINCVSLWELVRLTEVG